MAEFNPSKPDSFQRELIPEGPHAARCVRIIELGDQSSRYGVVPKAVIVLSVPGVTMEYNGEQKQAHISNGYGINISSSDKGFMRDYTNALNPNAQNLGGFLDETCQIHVEHEKEKDPVRQKIKQISALIEGIPVAEADTKLFWLRWLEPDPEVWEMISNFQKNLIRGSLDGKILPAVNYRGSAMEEMVHMIEGEEGPDDALPM